jgi:hypothetical protein
VKGEQYEVVDELLLTEELLRGMHAVEKKG